MEEEKIQPICVLTHTDRIICETDKYGTQAECIFYTPPPPSE